MKLIVHIDDKDTGLDVLSNTLMWDHQEDGDDTEMVRSEISSILETVHICAAVEPEDEHLEEVLKELIRYSFRDVGRFSDLTEEEQRIFGNSETFHTLERWSKEDQYALEE